MPFVSYDDGKVHYEADGAGPGLVMVHGAGGDADRTFGSLAQAFTDTHMVVRPNLSGSGKTTDRGGPLSLDLLGRQVMTATRAVTGDPVDLLGFSLGAMVAVQVAATHPESVRRLVLIAGAAHTTSPRDRLEFELWRRLLELDFDLFKRLATLQIFTPATLDGFGHEALEAALQQEWPSGVGRQVELSAEVDIRALLPSVRIPTLVIGFTDDQALPLSRSRELHEEIEGSRFETLPGSHMDWTLAPDRVAGLTQGFLRSP